MIRINLLNDIKATPVPSEHRERSEQDHKDLITTANKGIGAIRELKKHYGEETIIRTTWDEAPLEDIGIDDIEELEFGIKK